MIRCDLRWAFVKFPIAGAIQRDAAVTSHVSPFRFCLFLPVLRWTALIERLHFAAREHENLYRFSHAIVILTLGFCPRYFQSEAAVSLAISRLT
jgi:hypothetical protein